VGGGGEEGGEGGDAPALESMEPPGLMWVRVTRRVLFGSEGWGRIMLPARRISERTYLERREGGRKEGGTKWSTTTGAQPQTTIRYIHWQVSHGSACPPFLPPFLPLSLFPSSLVTPGGSHVLGRPVHHHQTTVL
jgi:hypothetical protein